MRIGDDIPHIQASCGTCGFIYDLKYGLECPKCQSVRIAWARKITTEQYKETMHPHEQFNRAFEQKAETLLDTVRRLGYPGRLSSPYPLSPGDELDVAELDRMFTLEDTRYEIPSFTLKKENT